ncbi:hypothetical protein VNI00_004593 [Paramarasmius palmivorus]|uniref:WSC domain-containing protein n=1 Tax=Paramarasmius palmivorus TaxID=297713 RepID=A0AAW0DJP7_9AGAR
MWSALLGFTLAASGANALLRFPCAQHTVTRADPLISPGDVSAHVHQVVGGNRYDLSGCSAMHGADFYMFNRGEQIKLLDTESLLSVANERYIQTGMLHRHIVAQKPGALTGNPNGGMVVYYIQIGEGFRMISGDPYLRSYDEKIDDSRSIMMRCLDTDLTSGPDVYGMPTTKCKGGIRSQINFPTCWDGKNVDTPNHKDHVAYAIGASFGNFGQGCPSTHPVQLPLLFFETYWDTTPFDNEWNEPDGQPFVWAMGDPTGYGYHADYMMGWPEDTLKAAMSQCTDAGGQVSACSVLHERSEQEMNDCAVPNRVEEDLGGWLTELPGCNPIYKGPDRAPVPTDCGAPTTVLGKDTVSFLKSGIEGWTPVGCASENNGETVLNGAKTTIGMMTVEKCLDYCNSQSMSYAGVKGDACSCSNDVDTSKFSKNYACDRVCSGDVNEFCGADNRIAVYSGKGAVDLPPEPSTTASNPTTTPTSNPGGGGGATVPKWGQCGGIGS